MPKQLIPGGKYSDHMDSPSAKDVSKRHPVQKIPEVES
jgi:hypothetical protein